MLTEARESTVYNTQKIPNHRQEQQMVAGLRDAWTLPQNDRVIYAHPERFQPGAIQTMIGEGKASAVVLHEGESVLGWAALVNHPGIGNVEIGSVNAQRGNGAALVEEIYKEAEGNPDQDILFFDVATCRTAMEGAAIKAADTTGLRIPVTTYIDPPVWGDKEAGITWGCLGLFAISRSFLEKKGPLELPKLPEDQIITDGAEAIIADIVKIGNVEGLKRDIVVFGARKETGVEEAFDAKEITEGLMLVDYNDLDTRKELAAQGYKPCGIELGKRNEKLTMGIHYSHLDPRESAHGRHSELTPMEHPTRTITASTALLTESFRMRSGSVYPTKSA